MHKCNTCGVNPVADDEDFCSTCNRAMDDCISLAFEEHDGLRSTTPKPLRYRKRGTDGLIAYSVENGAAMPKLQVLCVDRFFRVGEHQYRLIDSISVATYLIPDRMMEAVMM